jgi:hypothetical protein
VFSVTNHVAELFALRALDGEILIGKGVTAAQAAAGGSTPYLLEHLVEGYLPCVSITVASLRVIDVYNAVLVSIARVLPDEVTVAHSGSKI